MCVATQHVVPISLAYSHIYLNYMAYSCIAPDIHNIATHIHSIALHYTLPGQQCSKERSRLSTEVFTGTALLQKMLKLAIVPWVDSVDSIVYNVLN